MTLALTRRHGPHSNDCWHVYYSDVGAGIITRATGKPENERQWHCGFYPARIRARRAAARQ